MRILPNMVLLNEIKEHALSVISSKYDIRYVDAIHDPYSDDYIVRFLFCDYQWESKYGIVPVDDYSSATSDWKDSLTQRIESLLTQYRAREKELT